MSLDYDFKLAVRLQKEFEAENARKQKNKKSKNQVPVFHPSSKDNLSLIDPSLEYIDPNPDIHALFLHFNNIFFWKKLLAVEVKWSPRMTSCAGICCYQGRGALCSIRLSLPLLKLRPRKDLVETLLHEMIHAYLFVTNNNRDRDGHGPEFHKHMHRINKAAGTKITVYHTFHHEVKSYQQHWWKCQGPCKNRPPFFGMVRRAMNRAPGPNDNWWADHKASCGGSFVKVREPEGYSANKKGKGGGKTIAGKNNSKGKALPIVTGFPGISPKASGTTPMKGSGTNGVISTPKSGIYGYFLPSQDGSKENSRSSSTAGSLGKSGVSSRVQTVTTFGSSKSAETEQVETSKSFVPFTGKGNVLGGGDSVKSPSQRPGLASLLKKETEAGMKNAPKRSGSTAGGSSHAKQPKIAPISSPWKARVPPKNSNSKQPKIAPISSPWKARVSPVNSDAKQPKIAPISSPWKARVPPENSDSKQPKIAPIQSSWMAKVPPLSSTSIDSDEPSSSQGKMVKCPVCNGTQSEATINAHLDECIADQNDVVDDDVVCLSSNPSTDKNEGDSWFLECPGCRERVAEDDFDNHLNQCSRICGSESRESDLSHFDDGESSDSVSENPSCPICGVSLFQVSLGAHLENCLSSVYLDEDDGW